MRLGFLFIMFILLAASAAAERYMPDQLIVKYKSSELSSSSERLFHEKELSGIEIVKLPKGTDVEKTAKEYRNKPGVEYAEPNYILDAFAFPNDPGYSTQQNEYAAIGLEDAWNLTTGSRNVIIAIIDTGVDWNHPDLAANIWNNTDEIADNGIDDDGNGYVDDIRGYDFVLSGSLCDASEDCSTRDNDPLDRNGHGSHVAGIAAAVSNNSLGVVGACWNCTIMPVRAGYNGTDGNGHLTSSDVALAIIYAANNSADIISMSFGGSNSSVIQSAIEFAASRSILVAAAGNDNSNSSVYPAAYDSVISVAGTDNSDSRYVSSQFGSWVDVAAPALNVYSTYFDDDYSFMSGTSMAAPMVAGVIGLMKSYKSSLTISQALLTLNSTGKVLPNFGAAGLDMVRINATAALISLEPAPIAVSGVSLANNSNLTQSDFQLNLTTNVYADCNYSLQLCNTSFQGEIIQDTLQEGETGTYVSEGIAYELLLVYASSTSARFRINGELTGNLSENSTYSFTDKTSIKVASILYQDFEGGVHQASFAFNTTGRADYCQDERSENMSSTGGTLHSHQFSENDTALNQRYWLTFMCTNSQYSNSTGLKFGIDTISPGIFNITYSFPSADSAKILWNTSESANSTVEYGLNTSYVFSSNDSADATSHAITLSGLAYKAAYHFRVKSFDIFGNWNISGDHSFCTPDFQQITQDLNSSAISTINSSTGVIIEIKVANDSNASITITLGEENPNLTPLPGKLKYATFGVNDGLPGNISFVLMRIGYNSSELLAQNLSESSLRMYWFNQSLAQWLPLNTTLGWVFSTGIDSASHYVWANVSHFSDYAIGGLASNGYACSSNRQCYSNYCSSGACSEVPSQETPVGGSGSSGGGGGGGAAPSGVSASHYFAELSAGKIAEMKIGNEAISITQISFIPQSSVNGLSIVVKPVNEENISIPLANAYQYISISPSKSISAGATIEFFVNSSWLAANSFAADSVSLSRLVGSQWIKLHTLLKNQSSQKCNYSAQSPGFSYFAITAEKKKAEAIITPDIEPEPVINTTAQEPVVQQEKPEIKIDEGSRMPVIVLSATIILAVIALAALALYGHRRRRAAHHNIHHPLHHRRQ
jgi:PGF-pre-PGF domain-containing protein